MRILIIVALAAVTAYAMPLSPQEGTLAAQSDTPFQQKSKEQSKEDVTKYSKEENEKDSKEDSKGSKEENKKDSKEDSKESDREKDSSESPEDLYNFLAILAIFEDPKSHKPVVIAEEIPLDMRKKPKWYGALDDGSLLEKRPKRLAERVI